MRSGWRLPISLSQTVLLLVFLFGIEFGVAIDSQINTNPKYLASRDAIDKNAPSPLICSRFGALSMTFDTLVFLSFNPFNVFISETDVKPGLRPLPIQCRSVIMRSETRQ